MKRLLTISALLLILFYSTAWAGSDFAKRYPRIGHRQGNVVLDLGPEEIGSAGQWPDRSGNNNHANQTTAANQPAIQGSVGADVTIRNFDGGVDDMKTSLPTIKLPTGSTDRSILAWVKKSSYAVYHAFVFWGTQTATNGCMLYTQITSGGIAFYTHSNDFASSIAIPLNTWNQVVATVTGGDFVSLYLNGSLIKSGTLASAMATSSTAITVGSRESDDLYHGGDIASVQIFNTALTAAEIQYMYNQDRERFNQ